jgi:hypothetical protein
MVNIQNIKGPFGSQKSLRVPPIFPGSKSHVEIHPGQNYPIIWKPTDPGRLNPTHPVPPGRSLPTSRLLAAPPRPFLVQSRVTSSTTPPPRRLHHVRRRSTAPPLQSFPLFRILVGVPSQPPPPQLGVLRQRVLDNSPPPLLVLPPAGAPRAGWNLSCSRRHPPIRCARISSVEVLGKRLEPYRSVQLSN